MRITLIPFLVFYTSCFIPKDGDAAAACKSMPQEGGECDSHFDEWYYDRKEGKCEMLMYGDCPDDNNVFKTEEECKQTCQHAGKGSGETGKGLKGHHKPPKKGGSSEETERGETKRPGKKGSEQETNTGEEPVKKPYPTKQIGRPHRRRKRPLPPKRKGPATAHCGVRIKNRKCDEDYKGMWYNNPEFYTCSVVQKGQCPKHGLFFETCEECMKKCRRAMLHQCEYKS